MKATLRLLATALLLTLHVETEDGPKQTMQASATRKPVEPSE